MSRSEQYVTVQCEVKHITSNAVLITQYDIEAWIPRSVIWGPHETELTKGETELKMMLWKADQEGLQYV